MSLGTHAPPVPVPMSAPRLLSRFFVVFYWFLSQGVVDWSQRQGPGEEILGSILREKETRDRGPVMQIHQLFIYHLDTSISFYWNTFSANFSVGGRLCPVTIIREGSPVPVMCGAQSSESPRSFLPLAIISQDQRPLTGSHSLHSTGHMRTQTTHHPVQTDNVARLSRHWHHHLETELDTRRFSASQTWSQRCVKWPGDWWACLNVNHLSNDFPDLHMNWISNGETLLRDPGVKLKLEQLNAISSRMIDASVNVLIVIFLFNVAKLGLWATDD